MYLVYQNCVILYIHEFVLIVVGVVVVVGGVVGDGGVAAANIK